MRSRFTGARRTESAACTSLGGRHRDRVGETDVASLDGPFAAARAVHDSLAGEIEERWPRILRCVDGYDLPALAGDPPHLARFLRGRRSMLALVLEVEVELDPVPDLRAWTIIRLVTRFVAIGDATLAPVLPSAPWRSRRRRGGAIVGESPPPATLRPAPTPCWSRALRHGRGGAGRARPVGSVEIPGVAAVPRGRRRRCQRAHRLVRRDLRAPSTAPSPVAAGPPPSWRTAPSRSRPRRYCPACARRFGTRARCPSSTATPRSAACTSGRCSTSDAEDRARFRRLGRARRDLLVANGGSLSASTATASCAPSSCPRLFGGPLDRWLPHRKRVFDPAASSTPGAS